MEEIQRMKEKKKKEGDPDKFRIDSGARPTKSGSKAAKGELRSVTIRRSDPCGGSRYLGQFYG